MSTGSADPRNVAAGHRADLENPDVPEVEKEHSRAVLKDVDADTSTTGNSFDTQKNESNVVGGYKATLKNPNVSKEAKDNARQVLENKGVDY